MQRGFFNVRLWGPERRRMSNVPGDYAAVIPWAVPWSELPWMIHVVNTHTVSGFCNKLNIVPVLQQEVIWASVCENLIMIHVMCSCLWRFFKKMSCCSRILVSETCVLHLVTCCGRSVCTHHFLSYSCTAGRIRHTSTDLSGRHSLDCGP